MDSFSVLCIRVRKWIGIFKSPNRKDIIREKQFARRMRRNDFIFISPALKPKFYLPYYAEDYIQKKIASQEQYFEQQNLDYLFEEWNGGIISSAVNGGIVLDVGANIGNHSLYYIFEQGASIVHCFEPVPDTFRILKKNVEVNGLTDRIVLHNVGVGCNSGKASIGQYDKENIGGTTIVNSENGDIDVIAIDSLEFDSVALVKIDVEGFEVNAIKGMLQTLRNYKPFISIEIRDKNLDAVKEMLESIGYQWEKIEQHEDYADYLFYI